MDKAWSAAAGALVVATLAQGVGHFVDERLAPAVLLVGALLFLSIANKAGTTRPEAA